MAMLEMVKSLIAALKSRDKKKIKLLWGDLLLRNYFSGQEVNFGTAEIPDLQTISLEDNIGYFKAALASHHKDTIKAIWDGNAFFRGYFSGQEVNFGTAATPVLQTISLKDNIATFKVALASRQLNVIKAMWDCDLLRDYFSGQEVNFSTAKTPDLQTISLEDNIGYFKAALASQNRYIIKAMWGGNNLFRNYFSGHAVNFGTAKIPDFDTISLKDNIAHFKAALASNHKDVIKSMWDGNDFLQNYFSGQRVNFGTTKTPDFQTISLKENIANFKAALASRHKDTIKAIWDGNDLLRDYFSGQEVNFGTAGTPDFHTISLKDNIANFKAALASQHKDVIKAIWDGYTLLKDYSSGQAVNTGAENEPNYQIISLKTLCLLIKKVLSSSGSGKSNFIDIFINNISNFTALDSVYDDLKQKGDNSPSIYRKNQLFVLQARMDALREKNQEAAQEEPQQPEYSFPLSTDPLEPPFWESLWDKPLELIFSQPLINESQGVGSGGELNPKGPRLN